MGKPKGDDPKVWRGAKPKTGRKARKSPGSLTAYIGSQGRGCDLMIPFPVMQRGFTFTKEEYSKWEAEVYAH